MRRKTPADYHALAKKRGFQWLGPEVCNVSAKTGWECAQGHQWNARYSHIGQGRGCLFCADKARKTPADFRALAKSRGFQWLGPESPNSVTRTNWECEQGHQWSTSYSSIRQGSGCPLCAAL